MRPPSPASARSPSWIAPTSTPPLRFLEPSVAATWWAALETRFVEEDALHWAKDVTARLLGDDGPLGPGSPGARVRAAVLATQAAALIHEDDPPFERIATLWAEAEACAAAHPIPEEAERLRRRALLGHVAASLWADHVPARDHVSAFFRALLKISES
jgi:hypothetical protein